MSRLFIESYLDEDVSLLVGATFEARHYKVRSTQEAGNSGLSDASQLEFAAEQGWTLITHNRRDFEKLASEYVVTNKRHAGIIIAIRRPEPLIAQRLLIVFDRFTADEMSDQLLYI